MSKRAINHVAVLGSGVMGSRIAALFASIGVKVTLMDISPTSLTDQDIAKGYSLEHPKVKLKLVNQALQTAAKSTPAPFYTNSASQNIVTASLDYDLAMIKDADWIIEVVVENLNIKKALYERVEQYRRPGSIVSSNTSGIPIQWMAEGRSDDFQKHFCGTHFFNPPRYLKLLELIPSTYTDPSILEFLQQYGQKHLGKTTIVAKDTPAFIANRVGVFGFMHVFDLMQRFQLNIDDIDALTGTIIGRPKSATFRTADIVGLDTLAKVAQGLEKALPHDEANALFALPNFVKDMLDKGWIGDKNRQGFYKKSKEADGSSVIETLQLADMSYAPTKKVRFPSFEQAKQAVTLSERLQCLINAQDVSGQFYQSLFVGLSAYVSHRLPEIADHLYQIDDAMKAGFGWDYGPFEIWEAIGIERIASLAEAHHLPLAAWVHDFINDGYTHFYKIDNGQKLYYDIHTRQYVKVPSQDHFIILEQYNQHIIWQNNSCLVRDIGDGIITLTWDSKMNTIGGDVLAGIQKAISLAESSYEGLVIANSGPNFSAGANVGLIFMMAAEQEYDDLDFAIRQFQKTTMRIRYSSVPVVVAPHGLTLGGGCEICLHADAVQAAAETYMGLVELGVGLIPGGGGTKEMAVRVADRAIKEDIEVNFLQQVFINIGMAKVSTSAHEAYDLSYMRKGYDDISIHSDRRIKDAKQKALLLAQIGYQRPIERYSIRVQGKTGLGALEVGLYGMLKGKYISQHDYKVASKLAYVMCGGDFNQPAYVSEQYLLDLEREAFLSLCGERKTLERLQSIIKTGKPLRN